MISTITYNGDGVTRVFPVSFKIQGEDYVVTYINDVAVSDKTKYDIINNSIVFVEGQAPVVGTDNVQIVVASSPTEIADLNAPPSSVQTVLDNLVSITAVAEDMASVNAVSSNIISINSVNTNIVPNLTEILEADDNAALAVLKASEASASASAALASELQAEEWATTAGDVIISQLIDDSTESLVKTYSSTKIEELHQAIISNELKIVDNIVELKNIDKTLYNKVLVLGYYEKGDDGGGVYYYDILDTTSPDNSGTTIIATDNARWKLISNKISTRNFGAKIDGVTDDTLAINNALLALSGLTLYFPAGISVVSSTLTVYSKTKLIGDNSTLLISSSFPVNDSILQNSNISGTINTYLDTDITIDGIIFDGNMNALRTKALVTIFKVKNLNIKYCTFKNNTYMGLAVGGCRSVQINNSIFTDNGKNTTTTEGGSALWAGKIGDGSLLYYTNVYNCLFENNRWSAAYFMPNVGKFENNILRNNGESAVYMNPDGTNISFIGNTISGTTMKAVASSGLELWGTRLIIKNNNISACAKAGITLGDTQYIEISGNLIHENGQDTINYPVSSGIELISLDYSAGLASGIAPGLIDIHDNFIFDGQTPKTQQYAIQGHKYGVGVPTQITINNNNLFQQGTGTFRWDTGFIGSSFVINNNILATGANQTAFVVKQVISPATPGTVSVTGLGFKPSSIEVLAVTPSATYTQQSSGVSDGTTFLCQYSASSSAGYTASVTGLGVVHIVSPTNVVVNNATVAFDADGATFNFDVCTNVCYLQVKFFP